MCRLGGSIPGPFTENSRQQPSHIVNKLINKKINVMATSKSFFGLRRGSTKSFTFAVLDGKQITKEKAESVKNPRSIAQMRQRMLMATIGSGYRFMKEIADHSFEGKTAGQMCMAQFMKLNLNKFRADSLNNNAARAFNAYKDSLANPIPYILADGSLPAVEFDATSKRAVVVQGNLGEPITTAEQAYAALGMQKNDLMTFCYFYGEAKIENGVYYYTPNSFNVVRLTADRSGAITKPEEAFTISTNNADAKVSMEINDDAIIITSGNADLGTVILSRKSATGWLRSPAIMEGMKSIVGGISVANQLGTYPNENDYILNNGQMQNSNSAPSLPAPDISLSTTSVEITTDKGTASVPTVTGAPAGAAITYNGYDSSIISISGNTISAKGNGSTSVNVNVAATDTTSATSTKFQVVVSGQTSTGGDSGGSVE